MVTVRDNSIIVTFALSAENTSATPGEINLDIILEGAGLGISVG